MMARIRRRIWEIVEVARPADHASRVFDISILTLIMLNVLAVVLGSVRAIDQQWATLLYYFEVVSVGIFSVEYVARVWSCVEDDRFERPIIGRLRFMVRPMTLVDLIAILPFFLPFVAADMRSIRALRLFRLVRLAKVGRYYTSLALIRRVIRSRKEELVLTSGLMAILLVVSASVLYYCENPVQPEVFSSIPATMWWAVATLTTVGYGDMYPTTLAGKLCASVIAMLGIGMFALPTGILGAGFVEEVQNAKDENNVCPHCGKPLHQ